MNCSEHSLISKNILALKNVKLTIIFSLIKRAASKIQVALCDARIVRTSHFRDVFVLARGRRSVIDRRTPGGLASSFKLSTTTPRSIWSM